MSDLNPGKHSLARQIIELSLDAVPDFIQQHTVNKTLSVAVAELNKQVLFGGQDEKDTAMEALARLGFVHPVSSA